MQHPAVPLPFAPPTLLAASEGAANAALWIFVLYTVGVFLLAWFSHQILARRRFLSEYFLGSRGLGVLALTLTYGATSASAGSFAGFPALIYTHGWILALWIASYMIVPLCGMGLLGKRLNQVARKTGAITLPDVMRERFESPAVGLLATGTIIFLLSFYLVPQFKLASLILKTLFADIPEFQTATGWFAGWSNDPEYLLCLVAFAVLVVLYTTFGGFRAVVWTDVLQGFVMVFGVAAMLGLTLWQVGGLPKATAKLAQMTPPRVGTMIFTAESDGGYQVRADTWLLLDGEGSAEPRLLRTNQSAIIPAGQTASNEVKVVQITTPEEVAEIRGRFAGNTPPALPTGVRPGNVTLKEYAHGAGQRGGYVSGPGPDPTTEAGFLSLGLAVSFFFYWAISGTGQPGNMVRLMAFDSARTLRLAIASLSIYFGMIYFPLVIIFCCARILVPGLDQTPDRIMPVMAFTLSEAAHVPWLAGLLVAAPFAAAMSTVDSFMLMISSGVVRDIYQRNVNPQATQKTIKRLSYACTLIVGLVVTIGAINPPQFLQYLIVFTSGGLAVVFLFPVALALYWPRFNTAGAIGSMLGGFVSYLSLYIAGFIHYQTSKPIRPLELDPLVWGFAVSLLAGVLISLATKPPPERLVRKFFYREGRADSAVPADNAP